MRLLGPNYDKESEKHSVLCSLTFVLIYMGYPLISFASLATPGGGRGVSILYRLACLFLCGLIVFRLAFFGKRREQGNGLWIGTMLVFWTIYSLRITYDYVVVGIVGPMPLMEYAAYTIGTSVVPMITMMWIGDVNRLRLAPHFAAGIGFATCVLAAWVGVNYYAVDMTGRLIANERLNPITLGHSAAITTISIIWLLFFRKKRQLVQSPCSANAQDDMAPHMERKRLSTWTWFFGIGAIALSLYVLVLAASRSPILGFVIGAVLIVIRLRTRVIHFVVLAVGVVAALYQLGFMERLASLNIATSRITSVGAEAGDLEGGRGDLYVTAWQMFTNSPLVGESLFAFGFAYPHNIFLEALMATGVLGGSLLAAMLWKGTRSFISVSRRGNLGFWLLLLFGQAFIGTMTSGAIFSDPMFWTTLGLGLGLTVPSKSDRGDPPQPKGEHRTKGRRFYRMRVNR